MSDLSEQPHEEFSSALAAPASLLSKKLQGPSKSFRKENFVFAFGSVV